MKGLTILLSLLLTFNVAWAGQYDAALTAQLDAIADELQASNHDQEIMNMAYNRARVVRKQLNPYLDKLEGLEDATDEDIMPLLQDIADQLDALAHTEKTLSFAKKHLDQMLFKLEENRQAPTEIAILTIDGADPVLFSNTFVSAISSKSFNITNQGNGVASILGDSIDSPFGWNSAIGYPGGGGTCGATILPGETCTIVLNFQPASVGAFSGTLSLQYNDGVDLQSLTKDLQGVGI